MQKVTTKKIAWVTGASSGIGEQLALKLCQQGFHVVISARRENLLKQIVSDYEGYSLAYKVCDVTNKAMVKQVVESIYQDYGKIDCVFLNAGAYEKTSVEKFSSKVFENMIKVNYFGVVYALESILQIMKKQKFGYIGIVSSVAGLHGVPINMAYAGAKSALIKMSEALYAELKDYNLRMQIICPGFVKTPLLGAIKVKRLFMWDACKAADYIIAQSKKNKYMVKFPWQLIILMQVVKFLPKRFLYKRI